MKPKTRSVTRICEPTLAAADWHALQGSRFAALPQAVRRTLRALDLSDGAQLVFQDLFSQAVVDRFEDNLAVQRPRAMLESLSNKSKSAYSRILRELETAGLIVRRMTRHPATRYAQGWTVIIIQLPAQTWQAIRDDQYRDGKPSRGTGTGRDTGQGTAPTTPPQAPASDTAGATTPAMPRDAKSDAGPAAAMTPPGAPPTQPGNMAGAGHTDYVSDTAGGAPDAPLNGTRQATRRRAGKAAARPSPDESGVTGSESADTGPGGPAVLETGPAGPEGSTAPSTAGVDSLGSRQDVHTLWMASDAAGGCRVTPPGVVQSICDALIGLELSGDVAARQAAIRERLEQAPASEFITHADLARSLANQSERRTRTAPSAGQTPAAPTTHIPSDLMQTIRDRAQRAGVAEHRTVLEIGYSIACGVFRWHASRDRAIGSALKVIRSGRWQTPFGFDPARCRSQGDGSVVLHA